MYGQYVIIILKWFIFRQCTLSSLLRAIVNKYTAMEITLFQLFSYL